MIRTFNMGVVKLIENIRDITDNVTMTQRHVRVVKLANFTRETDDREQPLFSLESTSSHTDQVTWQVPIDEDSEEAIGLFSHAIGSTSTGFSTPFSRSSHSTLEAHPLSFSSLPSPHFSPSSIF